MCDHLYWFFISALLLLFWYIHKLTVFLRLLFHSIEHNFEQKQWKSTRQFVLDICTFTKAQIALCPFEVTKESNVKTIGLLIMYENHYQYIMFSYIKNYTAILLLTYKTLTFTFSTLGHSNLIPWMTKIFTSKFSVRWVLIKK